MTERGMLSRDEKQTWAEVDYDYTAGANGGRIVRVVGGAALPDPDTQAKPMRLRLANGEWLRIALTKPGGGFRVASTGDK